MGELAQPGLENQGLGPIAIHAVVPAGEGRFGYLGEQERGQLLRRQRQIIHLHCGHSIQIEGGPRRDHLADPIDPIIRFPSGSHEIPVGIVDDAIVGCCQKILGWIEGLGQVIERNRAGPIIGAAGAGHRHLTAV
jgi:hypothetical protein